MIVFSDLLWMDEILHHLELMFEHIVRGHLRSGIEVDSVGFLNPGAKIGFRNHPQYVQLLFNWYLGLVVCQLLLKPSGEGRLQRPITGLQNYPTRGS